MEISIIIVNYNVRDFLENTLHSVRKAMAGIDGEVFVVDNASQDGSVAMVREKFPEVHLVASPDNLGFGRANNIAMRQAKGRYFLILNPDTVVQEDTLSAMIRFMDAHTDAGMAGCKVLNADGTFQLSCRRGFPTPWASFCKVFGLSSLFPHTRIFAGYNLTYLDENGTYPIDALAGSFMIVRRAVFEQTKGFDEDFFMYGEDLDWCFRTQKAGWKIYYTSDTSIIHYKGESTKRSSIDEVRVFYDAMHIFVRKNFSAPFLFILFLRAGIAVRSLIAMVIRRWRIAVLVVLDTAVVTAGLLAATTHRFGGPLGLPAYAYPEAVVVPVLIVLCMLAFFGVYGRKWHDASRTAGAVVAGFFVISSLTFFFKEFAFSRRIVLEMSVFNMVALSTMRWALRARASAKRHGMMRRTVIVGTAQQSQQLLQRLRAGAMHNYDVVGFVGMTVDTIGKIVAGLPVLGSTSTIARVLEERDVEDVIFVSDAVPYADMLAMMQKCAGLSVTFRLVPATADVLLAKSGIDVLTEYPLVTFDLNIARPLNRIQKRLFDLLVAAILLVFMAPLGMFLASVRRHVGGLVSVLRGNKSLVGPRGILPGQEGMLGKPGLVSMGDVYAGGTLALEQREHFDMYYARNQSLLLDMNILRRALRRAGTQSSGT